MTRTAIFGLVLISIMTITMGFFDLFATKQNQDKKFVTENSYKQNKENQVKMAPQTLKQLRDMGVSETDELKLEYFFYTDNIDKAKNLANEIEKLKYTVNYGKSAGDKKLFVITGWTIKMAMADTIVINWTKQMCDLGYKFDCDFDGWGTEPDQE